MDTHLNAFYCGATDLINNNGNNLVENVSGKQFVVVAIDVVVVVVVVVAIVRQSYLARIHNNFLFRYSHARVRCHRAITTTRSSKERSRRKRKKKKKY